MIEALVSLPRLWYLILILSTVCLVSDITLSSTQSSPEFPQPAYMFYTFPLALAADVPTVLIFAYCIWGKSNPLLLPSSSPKSNVCTRCIRGTGSFLLVCLWIANTILYSVAQVLVRKILSGVAAMIAILILVEMIGSSRLGKQQRWFLKQEKRRLKQAQLDQEAASAAAEGSISEQGKGPATGASAGRRGKGGGGGGGGGGGWGMDSREGLLGDSNSDANDGAQVEIVRPPSVGADQVIFNQQLMYEMYQRQYHQHHQQYLMNQQPARTESSAAGPVGAEVEGKYDDLLLESSYKFEVPMDEPLEGASSVHRSPLESALDTKKVIIHLPSAPVFEKTQPPKSSVTGPSGGTAVQTSLPSILMQPKARSLSTAKDDIRQDTIRILKDSNPLAKDGECVVIQGVASAPPIESSSKLSVPSSLPSLQAQLDSIRRPVSSMPSGPALELELSENKQRQ